MFETHPSAQSMNILSVGDDVLVWKIIMQSEPTNWFYLTQVFYDPMSGDAVHARMILISKIDEFLAFVNAPWQNSKIGTIYLISPLWGATAADLDWDMDVLNEITEIGQDSGEGAAYVFETRWGRGYSLPCDGVWDQKAGRVVYSASSPPSAIDTSVELIKLACELHQGDLKASVGWLLDPLVALDNRAPCEMTSKEDRILLRALVKRLVQSAG